MRGADVHDVVVVTGICVLGRWLNYLVHEYARLSETEMLEGEGDDLFPDFGRADGAPRILMTPALGRRHMALIEEGRVSAVAVLDDPVDSVRFTKADKAVDTIYAIREQTRIAVSGDLLRDNPAVTLVARGFRGVAHDLVASLVERFGGRVDPVGLQTLLEIFGGPLDDPWTLERALEVRVPHYLPLDRLADAMPQDEAALVRQTVSPVALTAVSADIGTVTWTARVFYFGDRPNEIAPPVADVTGGARIIFYGPYFHLPPGTWKCRIVAAFSPEVRGTPFRVVIFALQDAIAKIILKPAEGGAFEGYFTMRHTRPERPIEVHFNSDEGTIEGHVALGQITFTRMA